MRKLSILIMALVTTSALMAADFFVDGIGYNKLGGDSVEVTSKKLPEYSGSITIPASVTYESTTYRVVQIGREAFHNCALITSITIPNSVTSIKFWAFSYCTSLTSITIPNSVTNIEHMPFFSCTSLGSINVDAANTHYASLDGVLFNYVKDSLIQYPIGNKRTTYTIPNSVTSIGYEAFSLCDSLHSIIIPNSVTSIGASAFYLCTSLRSIIIPNSVTSIGNGTFSCCSSLSSITIPNSVINIGDKAFYACSSLSSITMSNNVTSIGAEAFSSCSSLTSVSIPDSVTDIGERAFIYCSSLTSVTIGNNVSSIGWRAFFDCSSFGSITCYATMPPSCGEDCFGNVNKSIPVYVPYESIEAYKAADGWKEFSRIEAISEVEDSSSVITYVANEKITINESAFKVKILSHSFKDSVGVITFDSIITQIGSNAFSYKDIVSIVLPNTITTIETQAFSGCHELTSIVIPNSVTNIGTLAFGDCTELSTLTLSNSLTNIGNFAFGNCPKLQAINLPESVKSIGDWAFEFCNGLTMFYVPKNLIHIGAGAFAWCRNLASIEVAKGHERYLATDGVLFDITMDTLVQYPTGNQQNSYTIPKGIKHIGNGAFVGCESLFNIVISSTVTTIGERSFEVLDSLAAITCLGITPPMCQSLCFAQIDKSIPVYVPAESVEAYKSADGWKDFTNILPIECVGDSGKCGDNLTWKLSCDSVLTISGTGAMYDYYGTVLPWNDFLNDIRTIIIPQGLTYMYTSAFIDCPNLETVYWNVIQYGTDNTNDAKKWSNCRNFIFGDSVKTIPGYLCYGCDNILSINIPTSVTGIGSSAFANCTNLYDVYFNSEVPPTTNYSFYGDTVNFHIPCGSLDAYKKAIPSSWGMSATFVEPKPTYYSQFIVNDSTMGYIEKLYSNCEDSITVCAHAYPRYQFVQWKGPEYGTDTILSFKLYTDTVFYAEFEKMASDCPEYSVCGKCGDNAYWVLDSIAGTLTISGTGAMYDYEIAWFAKQGQGELPPWEPYDIYINKVIVEEGITRLGQNAFGGQAIQNESIQIVYLPSTLKTIGSSAFYCLDSLKYLQCDALTPPQGDNFKGTNQYAKVIVPCGTKAAYQADKYWRWFKNISDGSYSFVDSAQVCKYDLPYKWHCRLLYQSGIYADSMKAQTGCDSVYTLYFDVQDCFDPNHPQNPGYYQVSLIANPAAGGTVIGAGNYIQDTTITIYAHPNMGYRFDGWSDGVMDTIRQLHIGAHDTTLVANFTSDLYYICFRNEDGEWLQWDTLSYGEMPQYRGETPTKPSTKFYTYTFAGWWPTVKPATENATYYAYYDSVLTCVDSIVVTSYRKASELHICDFTKIIVTTTGFLDIDDSIAAKSLTFYVNNQNAAQIRGIEKLAITDVKMVVQLEPNHSVATPAKWYAFAVPFEVNLATDIKKEGAATPASYGSDFVVEYYDGALRATTQQGWVRCQASDVLQPGKFYMMAVNGTQNRWEISKRVDGTMSELYTIQAESNDSQSVNHRGWNGLGNTLWQSAVISVDDDSIPFATIYNNTQSVYEIVPFDRTIFATGSPFFVQVYRTSTVLLAEHTQQNVMARRSAMVENPYYELAFAAAIDADYIATGFVSVSASKANEYIIGRDVEKMLSKEPLVPQMWIEAYGTTLAAHEASLNGKSAYIPLGLYVPAAGEYRLSHVDNAQSYDLELQRNGQTVTEENPDSWKIYLDKGTNKEYTLVVTPRKTPTSVNQLTDSPAGRITKIIKDGQLLILRDGKTYNAQGGEVK